MFYACAIEFALNLPEHVAVVLAKHLAVGVALGQSEREPVGFAVAFALRRELHRRPSHAQRGRDGCELRRRLSEVRRDGGRVLQG